MGSRKKRAPRAEVPLNKEKRFHDGSGTWRKINTQTDERRVQTFFLDDVCKSSDET